MRSILLAALLLMSGLPGFAGYFMFVNRSTHYIDFWVYNHKDCGGPLPVTVPPNTDVPFETAKAFGDGGYTACKVVEVWWSYHDTPHDKRLIATEPNLSDWAHLMGTGTSTNGYWLVGIHDDPKDPNLVYVFIDPHTMPAMFRDKYPYAK